MLITRLLFALTIIAPLTFPKLVLATAIYGDPVNFLKSTRLDISIVPKPTAGIGLITEKFQLGTYE
jgi:hypothetical protein